MKLSSIFESKDDKKIKRPEPRPKKTLWFDNYEQWTMDIKRSHPDAAAYRTDDEDQIVALGQDGELCYGKWDMSDGKGVSFFKARTKNSVVSKKTRLERIPTTTDTLTRAAHQ